MAEGTLDSQIRRFEIYDQWISIPFFMLELESMWSHIADTLLHARESPEIYDLALKPARKNSPRTHLCKSIISGDPGGKEISNDNS